MNEEVRNGRVDLFMEQLRNWMWYSYHFSGGGGSAWGFDALVWSCLM